ncbi:hypothetical protein Tsubulata_012645 [Turnera subulata]|uniref:Malectin-like domain-containing protein n=1 Tax=Turnera subulata TaxID=218843 RepID=A0A9Q0FLY5_9ROSI|nr:hypothetical protein Tsubulata_012645 [Turnera subulata]
MPSPLLLFISLLSFLSLSSSQSPPPPRVNILLGILIDCGASRPYTINGREWLTDEGFTNRGANKNLTTQVLLRTLYTVRSFPLRSNNRTRKFCYSVPVFRGAKYLVRSTYFYGGVNGNGTSPPVFDQMVDGTLWSVVNTTDDYANGMYSYYEGVFLAQANRMSFCLGSNTYTKSDPFLSALEFLILGDSLYLSLDQFDRIWEPFGEYDPTKSDNTNLSVSGIWNLPPQKLFERELANGDPLVLKWPPAPLPNSEYYIALYFADDGGSSRVIDVSINGVPYFRNLNVRPVGEVVFTKRWPLGGVTNVTLTSTAGSSAGPLINGGEVFSLLPLGGRTRTSDVSVLKQLKSSFKKVPIDWSGDPCMPRQYSWTGITCSGGPHIRITSLNLTGMGLSGSLSSNISRLTGLTHIWLGSNNISGTIPDLGPLKMLRTLHLENNRLTGEIPSSLASLRGLREL